TSQPLLTSLPQVALLLELLGTGSHLSQLVRVHQRQTLGTHQRPGPKIMPALSAILKKAGSYRRQATPPSLDDKSGKFRWTIKRPCHFQIRASRRHTPGNPYPDKKNEQPNRTPKRVFQIKKWRSHPIESQPSDRIPKSHARLVRTWFLCIRLSR